LIISGVFENKLDTKNTLEKIRKIKEISNFGRQG
jgi:hypothetical protein